MVTRRVWSRGRRACCLSSSSRRSRTSCGSASWGSSICRGSSFATSRSRRSGSCGGACSWRCSTSRPISCSGSGWEPSAGGAPQTYELDREVEGEQVLVGEPQARELLDAVQALAQRVGMDEQAPRGRRAAAPVLEVVLERSQQLRAAALVVVDELLDGLAEAVVGRGVEREMDEVAVGAEVGVGERAAV